MKNFGLFLISTANVLGGDMRSKSLCFICIVVLFQSGIASGYQGQLLSDAVTAAVKYREVNFDTCWVSMSVEDSREVGAAPPTLMQVWVNGSSLRKDVGVNDLSRCIIHEGVYFVQYKGGMRRAVRGRVDEYEDIWAQFGLIHPKTIGMTEGLLSASPNGKTAWFLDSVLAQLPKDQQAVAGFYEEESGLTRFNVSYVSRLPDPIPGEVRSGLVSASKYIVDHPGVEVVDFEMNISLMFSDKAGGQLVEYQRDEQFGSTSNDVRLLNLYAQDSDTGIWYPKESRREVRHNNKLVINKSVVVQQASFGAVPAQFFTVEGLNLPDGQKVSDRTSSIGQRTGVIKNGELAFAVRDEKYISPVTSSGITRIRLIGIVSSILGVLLLVGALVLNRASLDRNGNRH